MLETLGGMAVSCVCAVHTVASDPSLLRVCTLQVAPVKALVIGSLSPTWKTKTVPGCLPEPHPGLGVDSANGIYLISNKFK